MILYSEIGGHELTLFLDMYLGVNEMQIGRRKNGDWLSEDLPMGYDADD